VPARVRPLLSRCLQKDPRKRLRDIGDAMSLVVPDEGSVPRANASRRWLTAGGWALAGVLATARRDGMAVADGGRRRGSAAGAVPDRAISAARGSGNLAYQRSADGTGLESPLFSEARNAWANDWSSDGRWVMFSTPPLTSRAGPAVGNTLWALPMQGSAAGTPVLYLDSAQIQQQAQFSPDGRFVAYGSDQSGTWEIYVQPFPNAAEGKWMISSGGGVEPRWSRDGKELFYFAGQTLMAVPVSVQPTFSYGAPVALFDAPIQAGYTADSHRWQVAPDGQRFLLLANAGEQQATPLDVVTSWAGLLNR
jgi:hypothetical protein